VAGRQNPELLLKVDEPGALSLLLQNKAAALKQLTHAARLGKVSLDKACNELQLLGESRALETAKHWLQERTKSHQLVLRDGLVRWIIGRRGTSLRLHIQEMEKAAGCAVSILLDQPTNTLTITGSQQAIDNVCKWVAANSHFTMEPVKILASQSGWIIGPKGASVKEMIQETGIENAYIDDTTVLLQGTQETVQKAEVYLQCQAEYYTQFHSAEDLITELKCELSEFPPVGRKSRS